MTNDTTRLATAPFPEAVADPRPYDIMEDRARLVAQLDRSPEIDALTSAIDVNDMTTIVTFGARAAEEISKASDVVLRSLNMPQLDESGRLLETLAKIMERFDIDEIRDNPTLFGRLFKGQRRQLDRILDKYNTLGDEVDKIYVQLRQYESEIKQSNQKLERLFLANVDYFHELEKYIVAGEEGCREIEDYLNQRRADLQATGDQSITFEIATLQQALTMLEQRTQDLRTAEAVALQSIPMLKLMEFSNMNLVRKINSAFIITLPVFKQALAQAILLKRQRIQAEALSALDQRTNEMLKRNARNTVEQSLATARLTSGGSVTADTLESAWRAIVSGIDETRRLQEAARSRREQDQRALEKSMKALEGRD